MNNEDLMLYMKKELNRIALECRLNSEGGSDTNKFQIYNALDYVQNYLIFFSNTLVSAGNECAKQKEELDKKDEEFKNTQKYNKLCEITMPLVGTLDLAVNGNVIFPAFAYLATLTLILLEKYIKRNSEKRDKSYKDFVDKKEKIVSDSRNQISKLKLAKEFIESITEEELNNYLSYKMGDSNE